MAIIYSYPKNTDILSTDVIVGTSTRVVNGKRKNVTKNFEVSSIAEFYNETSSIAITGQNNFFFQNNIALGRKSGSISFIGGGGSGTNFSSITTIRISKKATSGNLVIDYINTFVDQAIIIAQVDNLNNFGIYKFISITQSITEPDFYDIVIEMVNANGSIQEDKFYGFAIYPGFINQNITPIQNITETSQLINDGENGTSVYVEADELGDTAFSNDYNDLDNLPTIPTKTSDLVNDGEDGINPFITLADIPPVDISSKLDKNFSLFTDKTTPVDTDLLVIYDGNNKKVTFSNLKATLKTYFDTIYTTTSAVATQITTALIGYATESWVTSQGYITNVITALGFTPENVANKSTNTSLGTSDTLYPTQNAVKIYADSKVTDAIVDGVTTIAPSQNAVFDALALKQNTLTNPITGTGANGQVAFFNGTTTQTGDNGLFWDNTNKRLGVGTATANADLTITKSSIGTVQAYVRNTSAGNVSDTRLVVANDISNEGGFFIGSSTRTLDANTVLVYANQTLRFMTNNTVATGGTSPIIFQAGGNNPSQEAMRITGTGQVTIGATTAGARLDVRAQGALSTDIAFRVRNSANTADLMTVNGLGNLGIGKSIPTARLDVFSDIEVVARLKNSNAFSSSMVLESNNGNTAYIYQRNGANALGGFTGVNGFSVDIFGGANSISVFKNNGDVAIGGTITSSSTYTGSKMLILGGTGNVLINTTTDIPSSKLTIASTTQGFLPPRMTTTQRNAIATPAAGLIVYDTTDNKHYGYNGTSWYNMDADIVTTNRQSASYTLTLTDRSKLVEMDVATANNLTIPLNSSVAFPIGTKIDVAQYGAGQTTFVATVGVTIRSANNWLKINARYGAATLTKIGTDEWYLWGNLNA